MILKFQDYLSSLTSDIEHTDGDVCVYICITILEILYFQGKKFEICKPIKL